MAVAAKISAARALARKLCEEKEAAMAAARAAAEHSLDEEEIDRCSVRPAMMMLFDVREEDVGPCSYTWVGLLSIEELILRTESDPFFEGMLAFTWGTIMR
jgi:hypothetical protein